MLNLQLLVTDGILLTIIFSVFVVCTLIWKPRLWMHDFPADIQALMPPKTDREKRQTTLMAIPFFVLLFGGLGLTAARYGTAYGFLAMALHVYLVWQVVNIVDLVILDWGGMMLIDPMHPPIAGTEGAKGYRDFRFHFIGFIKGSVMGIVFALIVAGVVYVISM
jgi:hypothetical protein